MQLVPEPNIWTGLGMPTVSLSFRLHMTKSEYAKEQPLISIQAAARCILMAENSNLPASIEAWSGICHRPFWLQMPWQACMI